VSYFIETYGEDRLVQLIRSYAGGVTDDEAFTVAIGADLAAFDAAWLGSLDAEVPLPFGPRPAPPGPLPSGWTAAAADPVQTPSGSPAASASDRGGETAGPAPQASAAASESQAPGMDEGSVAVLATAALAAGGLLTVGVLVLARKRRAA